MKIAFVHPDLGIGGAERLIVDAAVALQGRGHQVTVYTSHYSPAHCFAETKQLDVVVQGDFLPRHIFGMLHLMFATLRSLYLAAWIFFVCPFNYDVIIVDQISFSIPILKRCADKVLFYCHYPDKYLAPRVKTSLLLGSWRYIYRYIFDSLEEKTIGKAHQVLVNSHFTGSKFKEAFPNLCFKPQVLHPAINTEAYDRSWEEEEVAKFICHKGKKILLSLNRFERKKNVELAVKSFAWLKQNLAEEAFSQLRFVIAGGYDPRVKENIQYLEELKNLCRKNNISYTVSHPKDDAMDGDAQVIFLPSITESQRNYLMHSALSLLYTPSFEHFGIVPVESMYCGLPVIAVNNGGPRETVINNMTGFLCESNEQSFGQAIRRLLLKEGVDPKIMSDTARKHVKANFTLDKFAQKLDKTLHDLFKYQAPHL